MSLAVERARAGRRPFAMVEMDLDFCTRTYGVAPCTAAIGVTGTVKCFNTRATCQDSAHYLSAPRTYRFCQNVLDLPRDLDALPFLESVSLSPTRLKIGSGLGERASVTLTLRDGLHNDSGNDPYGAERTYDPLTQGTFFGRFLARNLYYLGRPLRIKTGYLVDNAAGAPVVDDANFQTRLYFIEKIDGPDASGAVTITAKDILKLADDDRAQAPRVAQGRLLAALTEIATAATLTPTGIGDGVDSYGRALYPASGKLRINDEVMSFTRSGDALTLSGRGSNFTTAAAHEANDAVQPCYVATGLALHAILYDLLVNYAGVPAAYIPLADWEAETAAYSNSRLYSAVVSAPEGVSRLLNELCEIGPAYLWWDETRSEIIFRLLRPASSASLELTDDANFIADSIKVQDRLDLRVSEAWIYFGQHSPNEPLDKASNYGVLTVTVGDGETQQKYAQSRVQQVFSRWLLSTARTAADGVADSLIQRYDEAPLQIEFALDPKDGALWTGDLFRARTRLIQGPDGAPSITVFQVLQAAEVQGQSRYQYTALEERYTPSAASGQRIIDFSEPQYLDSNLRTIHDQQYAAPTAAVDVIVYIRANTILGSSSSATPAFSIGDWPTGTTITVNLIGRVQGKGGLGGNGGSASVAPQAGSTGGPALYTRFPITLIYTDGELWSGGGGGGGNGVFTVGSVHVGGSAGGGGAGLNPGDGGQRGVTSGGSASPDSTDGSDGTTEAGGAGGPTNARGGNGGGPGLAGETPPSYLGSSPAAGGSTGYSVDGWSYVTVSGAPGDKRGPTIN